MDNKPVAWIYQDLENGLLPALKFNGSFKYKASTAINSDIPLYTLKQLNDEEIEKIFFKLVDRNPWEHRDENFYTEFARVIIKEITE